MTANDSYEILAKVGHFFWEVYRDNVRSGAIYITRIPQLGYTLDAYKDMRIENELDGSYQAGKLVVDYFHTNIYPVLWTIHDKRNRIATLMCKKLGFNVIRDVETDIGKFIVLMSYNNRGGKQWE